jgi:site-specific DNA-methyltransferase (adenine-specific)
MGGTMEEVGFGDSGSAARFFAQFGGSEADNEPTRFRYQAKAGRRERFFFCRDCQSAHCETERAAHAHGHLNEAGKQDWSHVVAHPTVKPLDLIRYLVRLVTPPGGTILDCVLGTGTTAVAAQEEGFNFIGMEQDAEYLAIATARADAGRKNEAEQFPLFAKSGLT